MKSILVSVILLRNTGVGSVSVSSALQYDLAAVPLPKRKTMNSPDSERSDLSKSALSTAIMIPNTESAEDVTIEISNNPSIATSALTPEDRTSNGPNNGDSSTTPHDLLIFALDLVPIDSLVPIDVPSMTPSEFSSFPISALPSNRPSSGSTMPTEFPSVALNLVPNDSLAPSDVASMPPSKYLMLAPSAFPSDIPSNGPSSGEPSSTSLAEFPSFATSLVVPVDSLVPSMNPSDFPSLAPSVVPLEQSATDIRSSMPNTFPSLPPSLVLSVVPSSVRVFDLSKQPTISPEKQDPYFDPDLSLDEGHEGSIILDTAAGTIMDKETVTIFEEVCSEKFLPQVLPLVYKAEYSTTRCQVTNQTLLDNGLNGRRIDKMEDPIKQPQPHVTKRDIAILLNITSTISPPLETFDELITLTLYQYTPLLQQMLSEATHYFEPAPQTPMPTTVRVPTTLAAAIGQKTNSDNTEGWPIPLIAGAVVGGVLLVAVIGAAFYLNRR